MPYPWPSVGDFIFGTEESPLDGIGGQWTGPPRYQVMEPLGSAVPDVVTLSLGTETRRFDVFLSPTRYSSLRALVNTSATFTDWERPTPQSRTVLVADVENQESVAVVCSDGSTQRRIRTQVTLVGQ